MVTVTHRSGAVFTHQVAAVVSYRSGLLLALLDLPWQKPTDPFYEPHGVMAVKQSNPRHSPPNVSCWREVWGDVRELAAWAQGATVNTQLHRGRRIFTKEATTILPTVIEVPLHSDCVSL